MAFSEKKFKALSHTTQAKKIAELATRLLHDLHQQSAGPGARETLKEIQVLLSWYGGPLDNLNVNAAPLLTLDQAGMDWQSHEFISRIYILYLIMRQHAGLGPEQSTRRLVQQIARESSVVEHYNDLSEPRSAALPYRLALYNLRSAHNAGSLLRLADCMGLQGALLCGYTPGRDTAGFRAASMGCEDWLTITRISASVQALRDALPRDGQLIALELSDDSIPLPDFKWPRAGGLIVLGNEELGLPEEVMEACHASVMIPMFGRKASLNVSTAGAMALYDLRTKYAKL